MGTRLGNVRNVLGTRCFWHASVRLAFSVSAGLAVLLVAMSALILVLPLALVVGLTLHLYARRALRQTSRDPRRDLVIEGEYVVVERR